MTTEDLNTTKEEKKPEKKMSMLERMKKNSTIKAAEVLTKSPFFHKKDMIQTKIPALNIALSGAFDGGFVPGLTLWCGPSKHFKSLFSLIMAKAYMDKYPEAILMFYDSEYGTPIAYFQSLDIDMSRVLHIPIKNMEEFKFDVMQQLEGLTRGERVIFVIDSLGNLASKKEVDDAIEGNTASDMSRAKQMKSIFRMVTPYLNGLDIPMVAVNHIYMTQEKFSKAIVSGGCLAKGSEIRLSDGVLINIEDIEPGMRVATLSGDNEVTRTWTPDTLADGEPECYEITFEDGTTIVCSDAHEFLIDGNWVEASLLKVGDDCQVA